MAGFCYFVEGDLKSLDLQTIEGLSLSYAFDSAPACRESAGKTPSGNRGLFFADSNRLGELMPGYYPDKQTWREMPTVEGQPRLFVGYWNDAKPTPQDLAREKPVDGLMVKLADGNMWQVPEVRNYNEQTNEWECRLPCYLDYDMSGKIKRGLPMAEYSLLWDATAPLGSELFDAEVEGRAPEVDDQQMADCVAALLQANYAVSFPELVVLGVLTDTGDLAFIVMAACKKDKLLLWMDTLQKKSGSPLTLTG